MEKIHLLALSGSLRKASYNTALNRAMQQLAPQHADVSLFEAMADLPLFNPDMEDQDIAAVKQLKQAIAQAHGLIISSPEYAHGISSVMKNALDWLVSGAEFPGKPVALFNASPRANHAQTALREVLKTMSANIVDEACVAVPLLGSGMDAAAILQDTEICETLQNALQTFCNAIRHNLVPNRR